MGVKRYRVNTLPGRFTRDCPEVVLVSDFDALAAERDALKAGTDAQVWFHLQMENHRLTTELDALKAAIQEAAVAIEDGADLLDADASLERSRSGRYKVETEYFKKYDSRARFSAKEADQLRALLEIVK